MINTLAEGRTTGFMQATPEQSVFVLEAMAAYRRKLHTNLKGSDIKENIKYYETIMQLITEIEREDPQEEK